MFSKLLPPGQRTSTCPCPSRNGGAAITPTPIPRPTITRGAFLHSQSPQAYLACAAASVTGYRATGRRRRDGSADVERACRR